MPENVVMQEFELTERSRPNCHEIHVQGELDLSTVERLQEALIRAADDHDQILICLESCDFIDSTGISAIVQAHNQLEKEGKRVAVYGPQDQVLRILTMTGLTENGLVFDKAEEAFPPSAEPV